MVFSMDFSAWNCFDAEEKAEARGELKAFLAELESMHQAKEGSYAFYDVNGYKGDLLLWILAPSLEDLAKWERKFRRLTIASVLVQTYSYTSVTEVSAYVKAKLDTPEVDAKLYPTVPKDKYICFYNMTKKREGNDNWYMLPQEKYYLSTLQVVLVLMIGNGALLFLVMMTSNSKKLFTICALKKRVHDMVSSAISM